MAAFTKPRFNSYKNSVFLHSHLSRQSLCQAAVDTSRVYELDFNFVLGSRKLTPEMESYLP